MNDIKTKIKRFVQRMELRPHIAGVGSQGMAIERYCQRAEFMQSEKVASVAGIDEIGFVGGGL